MFLVSEPDYNRVGLYNADTFKFDDWLNMADGFRRHPDHSPREMKILTNGKVTLNKTFKTKKNISGFMVLLTDQA